MTTQSGASWGASPPGAGRGIWGANTDIATCGLICTLRYFYRFMVCANLISSPSQSNPSRTTWGSLYGVIGTNRRQMPVQRPFEQVVVTGGNRQHISLLM